MKIKRSYNDTMVEFVYGGGVGFMVTGLLVGGGGIGLLLFQANNSLSNEAAIITHSFATILLVVSFWLLFGRHGIKIDSSLSEIIKWRGLTFLPLFSTRKKFYDFNSVQIERQLHRSKNSSYYSYPVLMTSESEKDFVINNQKDIIVARQVAETGAKYMKLRLLDKTGSVETVRNYDELDLSIRELAAKKGVSPKFDDVGEMPASLRAFGSLSGNQLSLEMPANNLAGIIKKLLLIPFLIGPVFFIIFLSKILASAGENMPPFILPVLIAIIILSLPITFILINKKIGFMGDVTRICANKNSLEICYGKKQLQWDAAEIEELILLPGPEASSKNIPEFLKSLTMKLNGGVLVRSDRLYATFAYRFTAEEQQWIYKTLYAILAG
ncbi:MAG: hypothetical protein L3J71_07275 [Victivallaceae bacterium]|nr:hypothetical protein [Victivallaceae bacterium]